MIKSAGALIINNKKVLMLLRDDRSDIPNSNCWSLIGGEIEEGENETNALIREIKEESSMDIERESVEFVGKIIIPQKQEYHLYWIRLDDESVKDIRLGSEGQELKFFSVDEMGDVKMVPNLLKYYTDHKDGIKEMVEHEMLDREKLGFNKNGIFELSL